MAYPAHINKSIYYRYSQDKGNTWSAWKLCGNDYAGNITATSIIDYVKTLPIGNCCVRLDNMPDGPITSGGFVYDIVKTHEVNDTRCVIKASRMDSTNPDLYVAFIPQSATTITWKKCTTASV